MVMTGLRVVAIAVVGFVFASPAYANGQVENAMQLWLGDLRTAYDKSVDLIEDRKINDAKGAVEELQELTYQMTTATDQIEENAKSLALNWVRPGPIPKSRCFSFIRRRRRSNSSWAGRNRMSNC